MSLGSICPDDLLLAARRGELTSSNDEARLAFHLERCARCRAALSTGRAFDVVLGARVGDDEIATRIAARVTERKSRRFGPLALAVGLMLSASLAVAAVGVQRIRVIFQGSAAGVPAVLPAESGKSSGLIHSTAPRSQETLPSTEAASGEPAASDNVSNVEAEPTAHPAKARAGASRPTASAAELFAQANALRGAGKSQAAEQRYLELQAHYPQSSEARVSLVSLGRLELASRPSQALRHFSAYLAQSSHQTLNEEALFGQATALLRLGKVEQERAAWRKLLERYPSSVYADRAKARLTP
jgi:TolA-binding protein